MQSSFVVASEALFGFGMHLANHAVDYLTVTCPFMRRGRSQLRSSIRMLFSSNINRFFSNQGSTWAWYFTIKSNGVFTIDRPKVLSRFNPETALSEFILSSPIELIRKFKKIMLILEHT